MRYVIELSLTGQVDISSRCSLSTGERLALLRARARRRRRFEPEKLYTINIPCSSLTRRVYDFADGVFSIHFLDADDAGGTQSIAYYLPAQGSEAPRRFVEARIPLPLTDHRIDPSRDLVACLQVSPHTEYPDMCIVYVYLRTLSSGGLAQHPDATQERLETRDYGPVDENDATFYLAGDHVAYFSSDILCIWRWTTGFVLIVRNRLHGLYLRELTYDGSTGNAMKTTTSGFTHSSLRHR